MSDTKETEKNYKIKFVDRILDPVHGFIDLTQVEKEIIELPIFKRMQNLKQLSLTNLVFPGAEHTRYMHSLGVMYIADLMAINLKDVYCNLKYNDAQRQVLRLAGLLHDIGHYPLSHVTEYVYTDNLIDEDDTLLNHNKKIKKDIDNISGNTTVPEYMKSRYSKPMHHETIGTNVIEYDEKIRKVINKYCPFINIEDIQDIIVGCIDRNPKISSMVQLLHSELDADGIDYVMRDATFSGTSYGVFELGLLLRNLVVTSYNGVDIVGVQPKGIPAVDQYLVSKYFAYKQVIFNRHVAILDEKSCRVKENTVLTQIFMIILLLLFLLMSRVRNYIFYNSFCISDIIFKNVFKRHNCSIIYCCSQDNVFIISLSYIKWCWRAYYTERQNRRLYCCRKI